LSIEEKFTLRESAIVEHLNFSLGDIDVDEVIIAVSLQIIKALLKVFC